MAGFAAVGAPAAVAAPVAGEMAVYCDSDLSTPGMQLAAACDYPSGIGTKFDVQVHVTALPEPGGYAAWTTKLKWTDGRLQYNPTAVQGRADLGGEFLWATPYPGILPLRVFGSDTAGHGDLTRFFAPAPLSTHVGPMIQLEFECKDNGTSPIDLISLNQNPAGANFILGDLLTTLAPNLVNASVHCGPPLPVTTIDSGPPDPTNDNTPTFNFHSSEVGATFECNLDGGGWVGCTSAHTTTSLDDGDHTFDVKATGAAGTGAAATYPAFTVDTDAPAVTIDSGPEDPTPTPDPTPTFAFSSEDGATYECKVDGAPLFSPCSGPGASHTTAGLPDGPHTFHVQATDEAGNTGSPVSRAFTVLALPETTIDSGPPDPTNDNTPTFNFHSSEVGATFECNLDGGGWVGCTSAHTTTSLDDGDHTFDVKATGASGTGAAATYPSFTVDTDAPAVTIDSGPLGTINLPSASFAFSSEAGTTFECKLDDGGWVPCSPLQHYNGLSDGLHTFQVRATDEAGNTGSPVSRAFTVDTTPPPPPPAPPLAPPPVPPLPALPPPPPPPLSVTAKDPCSVLKGKKRKLCVKNAKRVAKCNRLTAKSKKAKRKQKLCLKKARALAKCDKLTGKSKKAKRKKAKCLKRAKRIGRKKK